MFCSANRRFRSELEILTIIKVFYECGATPTACKYNVTAVRNEITGHFELFELGEHSHPVRANVSSGMLLFCKSLLMGNF